MLRHGRDTFGIPVGYVAARPAGRPHVHNQNRPAQHGLAIKEDTSDAAKEGEPLQGFEIEWELEEVKRAARASKVPNDIGLGVILVDLVLLVLVVLAFLVYPLIKLLPEKWLCRLCGEYPQR